MSQRSGIFVGSSFTTTFIDADVPHWRPLEALSALVRQRCDLPHFHPGEFMFMASLRADRRRLVIHLYKHIDTRRYLNLDDAGHAFVYIETRMDRPTPDFAGRYRQLQSLRDALDRLDLHLFEVARLQRSFPPERWPVGTLSRWHDGSSR